MCESYDDDECFEACPMNGIANDKYRSCTDMAQKNPERAIKIVQKWSDEHPVMTRLDDLLEKCPKISLNYVDKVPYIKPHHFGYCKDCAVCPLRAKSSVSLTSCWNEPLAGGATGKAVG
jgi:hypothetical protein